MWQWSLYIALHSYKGFFDSPENIWMLMNLNGVLCGIAFPRAILIVFHFSGVAIKRKSGEYISWLSNTGIILASAIFIAVTMGTLRGRFNFKTEEVTIPVKGLKKDLDGLRIVQISDLHLSTFFHHSSLLSQTMEKISSYEPDLIINTGDFVSYGWREYEGNESILLNAIARYGNFAVLGNHDSGIYNPVLSKPQREENVLEMNVMVHSSGYTVLNDANTTLQIGNSKIGIIGVTTGGRHPDITHGDLKKAMAGLDSVDFKILLSHDPNHWEQSVTGKTNIDLTLSGHTHGMQMGILTKNFKWSPAKYFYPHWNGLYKQGNQYLYVNRGLGVLAIPFRIWMPPEITIITLKAE
jgi:uncharacterized protein